jgi:K+/H+ antiporter YhaU regulatory subunit KhtT
MNPSSHDRLESGDRIMVMGNKEQIAALQVLVG